MVSLEWYLIAFLAGFLGFCGGLLGNFLGNWAVWREFRAMKKALISDKGNETQREKAAASEEQVSQFLADLKAEFDSGKQPMDALKAAGSKNLALALPLARQFGVKI